MAFTTPYTFTALETLTAAKMNAIQSNISAIWVGTTAGDTDYYTSSTAKSRLAIGSAYQKLFVNGAGTAPVWGSTHFASVYHNTTQNLSNGVSTILLFNSENSDTLGWHSTSSNTGRMTVTVTGGYVFTVFFEYSATGGGGSYRDLVEFKKNGTTVYFKTAYQDIEAQDKAYMLTTPITALSATDYMEVSVNQNSGGTRAVQANSTYTAERIY